MPDADVKRTLPDTDTLLKYGVYLPSVAYAAYSLVSAVVERARSKPKQTGLVIDEVVESGSKLGQQGWQHQGMIDPVGKDLIQRTYDKTLVANAALWQDLLDRKDIFWINLHQTGEPDEKTDKYTMKVKAGKNTLDVVYDKPGDEAAVMAWAQAQVKRSFPDEPSTVLDGFGYIVAPIGSKTQKWHIDYNNNCASVFIPLVNTSPENSTQYLQLPPSIPKDVLEKATANTDEVNFDMLRDAAGGVSIRQVAAQAWSVCRMGFGCIHRGIQNRSDYHRPIFWISVRRNNQKPSPYEPGVTLIPDNYDLDKP